MPEMRPPLLPWRYIPIHKLTSQRYHAQFLYDGQALC